jgi:hypothetical protein
MWSFALSIFSPLKSALSWLMNWIFRTVIIKFVILTVLWEVVAWVGREVLSKLDISPLTDLQSNIGGLPSGILYFCGLFRVDIGLPLVMGAMLTKFLIRRIPIIG